MSRLVLADFTKKAMQETLGFGADTFGELSEAEPVLPPQPDNRFVSSGAPRQFLAGLRFRR
ncbi:MAG TPA: hypothetical protein VF376_13675 [Thermoanaerobaculia bacterium]